VGVQTHSEKIQDDKTSDSGSNYLMHPEQAYELTSSSIKLSNITKPLRR
jgi:hypothetical protein